MEDRQHIREELERRLKEVKEQIAVLDMMEERLLEMKRLLFLLIAEDEDDPQAQVLRDEITQLEEQVNLLSKDKNEQS